MAFPDSGMLRSLCIINANISAINQELSTCFCGFAPSQWHENAIFRGVLQLLSR